MKERTKGREKSQKITNSESAYSVMNQKESILRMWKSMESH